jgi:hypothetical protein
VRREEDVRAVLREIERWLAEARVTGAATAHPTTTMNEFGGGPRPTTTTTTTGKTQVKSGLSTGSAMRFSRGARWSPSLASGCRGVYARAEHDFMVGNVRR